MHFFIIDGFSSMAKHHFHKSSLVALSALFLDNILH
jgi:hypothetical protein